MTTGYAEKEELNEDPFAHIYDTMVPSPEDIPPHLEICDGLFVGEENADNLIYVIPGNGADAQDYYHAVTDFFTYTQLSGEESRDNLAAAVYNPRKHYGKLEGEVESLNKFIDCVEENVDSPDYRGILTHSAGGPLTAQTLYERNTTENPVETFENWDDWDTFVGLGCAFDGTSVADAGRLVDSLTNRKLVEMYDKAYNQDMSELLTKMGDIPDFLTRKGGMKSNNPEVVHNLMAHTDHFTITGGQDHYFQEDTMKAIQDSADVHGGFIPYPIAKGLSLAVPENNQFSPVLHRDQNFEFEHLGHSDIAYFPEARTLIDTLLLPYDSERAVELEDTDFQVDLGPAKKMVV